MVPVGTMRERTPGNWELVVSAGLDPVTGRYRRVIRQVKIAAGRVSPDDPTVGQLLERGHVFRLRMITGSSATQYGRSAPLVRGHQRRGRALPLGPGVT